VAKAAASAAIAKVKGTLPSSPTKSNLESIGATALASAAVKATVISSSLELEMQKQTRVLIETELKKIQLKLDHFQKLETILDNERKEVERERGDLYRARLEFKRGNMEVLNGNGVLVERVDGGEGMGEGANLLAI
jgi:SWI/SNF related-matrix-associated actin-dependent regulator of chromatin subfamily C